MSLVRPRPRIHRRRRAANYYMKHMLEVRQKIFEEIYQPRHGRSVELVLKQYRKDISFNTKPKIPHIKPRKAKEGADRKIRRENSGGGDASGSDYAYDDYEFDEDTRKNELAQLSPSWDGNTDLPDDEIIGESVYIDGRKSVVTQGVPSFQIEQDDSEQTESYQGDVTDTRPDTESDNRPRSQQSHAGDSHVDRLVITHDEAFDDDDDDVVSRVDTPNSSHYEDTDDESHGPPENQSDVEQKQNIHESTTDEETEDDWLDRCLARSHYGGYVPVEETEASKSPD